MAISLALPGVRHRRGRSVVPRHRPHRHPVAGQTIADAHDYFQTYPLYLWAPVSAIIVLVLALNLLGDSIRDAFDPKTRR